MCDKRWLTVVMPTWNGGKFLEAALDSVVAQKAEDFEVIIVDDGSTDQTLAIASTFLDGLPLRIEARAHRGNWVVATNEAMALARGEYICWLHQDDVWHPSRLEMLRQLTRQSPDVDLFLHPVHYIDDLGRNVGRWHCPLRKDRVPLMPPEVVRRLLVQNFIATVSPIFKASAARAAGPLNEFLWYSADWDFWLKLSARGKTIYDPTLLSSFRVHSGSQSMNRSVDIESQLDAVLDTHLPRWAALLPDIAAITRVGRFSNLVNAALCRLAAGQQSQLWPLFCNFVMLGPPGWRRYIRDSRIIERTSCRIRARVRTSFEHSDKTDQRI